MVSSSALGVSLLSIFVGVGAFALFIYSCIQLKSMPADGSACPASACALDGGSTTPQCISFGITGQARAAVARGHVVGVSPRPPRSRAHTHSRPALQSCDDICALPRVTAASPFRYRLASGSTYAYCAFPKKNTYVAARRGAARRGARAALSHIAHAPAAMCSNWRIPTTVFLTVICAIVVPVAIKKKSAGTVLMVRCAHARAGVCRRPQATLHCTPSHACSPRC